MKHKMPSLLVHSLLLFALAPFSQASAEGASLRVDPACLWALTDGAMNPDAPPPPASVPVSGCAPVGTLSEDGEWTRVAIEPTPENDYAARFSGTRVTALPEGDDLLIEAYENYGGSGTFSSLITARVSSDKMNLGPLHVHGLGDRCNGGLARADAGPDGKVRVRLQMTPFDLLAASMETSEVESQWDALIGRFGDRASSVPSCASCCTGVTAVYQADVETGAFDAVGYEADAVSATQMGDDPVAACIEKVVVSAAGTDSLLPLADARAMAVPMEACFSLKAE